MPTSFALGLGALAAAADHAPVEACVRTFAEAATTRDTTALAAVLDPSAVQHILKDGAWSALPTAAYLDLMARGALGGQPVAVDITRVDRRGPVAAVTAVRTTPTHRFEDQLTLAEGGGRWRIVAAAVVVSPVAP